MTRSPIEIDFMYLDLGTCTRCQGTDASLEEAIAEVSRVLKIVGVDLVVRKTHIDSEQRARQLGFISSPTILINGRDVQESLKESQCDSCTQLAGGQSCNCRVWSYQGGEYIAPPAALIVDAILRAAYGAERPKCQPQQPIDVPQNIKSFFASRRHADD